LINEPTKHHAVHLATLREKCAKNPLKLIKHYNENNEVIINSILSNDYYMKIQESGNKQAQQQAQKPAATTTTAKKSSSKKEKEEFEEFDKFEQISDDPNYQITQDTEKELMKSKNAKKFMVSDH
jgi:small-conductance mechanosensitive channel